LQSSQVRCATVSERNLEPELQQHLQRLLTSAPDSPASRLLDDARRLWHRVQRLIELNLTPPELDRQTMELACHALQLPDRTGKPVGKLGQVNLRERAEQAAELLISSLSRHADEQLIDRATMLLRELPLRSPKLPEAKLLADAVNLDDFGLTGLLLQAMQLARQHASVTAVVQGFVKRQQYGYWEARLKDGFHFEPIRQMARQRLQATQQAISLLLAELQEDQSL